MGEVTVTIDQLPIRHLCFTAVKWTPSLEKLNFPESEPIMVYQFLTLYIVCIAVGFKNLEL